MNKLFITDLDGTFVFDSINVNELDLKKIKEIKEHSKIAVATGRSVKEIEYIEKVNNIKFDYKIGFNGAIIEDKLGNVIFSKKIDKDILERLYKYIKENNLIFDALDGKERIGNFSHEKPESLWNMEITCLENPYEILKDKEVYKLNIRPPKDKSDIVFKKLVENFKELSIIKTSCSRIEICSNNISKGNAIEIIKKIENLYIVSVGDSENDKSMLEVSDKAICMAHSPESIKKISDLVVEKFNMIEI